MSFPQSIEPVSPANLLESVEAHQQEGCRLVQISATRLPEGVELLYSFDLHGALSSLRLMVPRSESRVPSISSVYWCAFLYENEIHDLFELQFEGLALDFQGNLYKTTLPFAFTQGPIKAPVPGNKAPASVPSPVN